jgi:hypothetical protein
VPSMSRRELLERGLHVAVLWGFAVALPLFAALEPHPEFFATRDAAPGEILTLALVVTFAVPLGLLVLLWLASLAGEAVASALQLLLVGALVALIALQIAPPAIAAALGVAGAIAYARLTPARVLLTVLGPAPLVILALFLASGVLSTDHEETAPVVLVVFDEFPVTSLMGADGRIDRRRYPNFARLAGDATWYRDTASVDQDTPYAVPAILDGRLPRRERLPVAADHPRSIFTLLGPRYELHVNEDGTALCAPQLCHERDELPLWKGAARVYAHELLPDDYEDVLDEADDTAAAVATTRRVPDETKRERYVRIHRNLAHDRPQRFEEFVDEIEGGRQPRLHLIHILLPHVPYQYLPSGQLYRRTPREELPGLDSRPGYAIPYLVEQSYQRHLLQVEYTDRLLGKLLDRLHELGIYDHALVAVVADHGISFRLGHDRRLVRRANVQDIAPVPFLLKAPGQHRGRISDRPLQTIDVLPTVADELGIEIPWTVDGRSALADPKPRTRTILAKKFKHRYPVDTPSYEPARKAALERKLRLFGDGVYAFGPRPDLIGKRLPPGGRRVVVDPDSGFVPAHLAGTIPNGRPGGGRTVAVAVNGRVIVPERALHAGSNRVELLLP